MKKIKEEEEGVYKSTDHKHNKIIFLISDEKPIK